MGSKDNRDTDPHPYAESDTEVEALDPPRDAQIAGTIDDPLDRATDAASIHDRRPELTTNPDRETWPAASTLPFARGKDPGTLPAVRIDSDAPPPQNERPMVGKRYLNYEIRRRLARGSMGLVYEANHLHLRRRVAIKFLSPRLLGDENMVYRFLGEAQAMARIDHPAIPTIFDFGQDAAGNAYLIMDYLEGESLAAKLDRSEIPLNRSLEIAAQTAEILAAAHSENIVHRDLKPENILLCDDEIESPDGPQPIVRLIDFGICKAWSGDQRADTVAGNLIGTPRYMAPEQTYSKAVSAKTDVYALGCVLFELVCGRGPFDGKLAELVDAHRHRVPVDIRHFRPSTPPSLAKMVARMLSKEPGARPASGSELAAALRACKVSESLEVAEVVSQRRAALPTPRAGTARAAVEDGVLSADRTPLPFRRARPNEGREVGEPTRVPYEPPFDAFEPPFEPPFEHAGGGGGTTEVSIASSRASRVAFACFVLILLGLAAALAGTV